MFEGLFATSRVHLWRIGWTYRARGLEARIDMLGGKNLLL